MKKRIKIIVTVLTCVLAAAGAVTAIVAIAKKNAPPKEHVHVFGE